METQPRQATGKSPGAGFDASRSWENLFLKHQKTRKIRLGFYEFQDPAHHGLVVSAYPRTPTLGFGLSVLCTFTYVFISVFLPFDGQPSSVSGWIPPQFFVCRETGACTRTCLARRQQLFQGCARPRHAAQNMQREPRRRTLRQQCLGLAKPRDPRTRDGCKQHQIEQQTLTTVLALDV